MISSLSRFHFYRAVALAALLLTGLIAPTLAQSPEDWNCTGNLDIPPDQQITGCTNAIQSGKYSGKDLGWAYYNRGNAYDALNDITKYDLVIADYSEAIRLDPKFIPAYTNRGDAYSTKGDDERAIADYSEVIRLDPKSASAYLKRGGVYYHKGDYDHAIADLNEAIRLDPKHTFAHDRRGGIYNNKGDYEHAIADYSEAIRLNPKSASAYGNRGGVYNNKGDYEHAIADYSEAINLDPKSVIDYLHRGLAYFAKGDYGRAIADCSEAIKLGPKYVIAYSGRGIVYLYANSLVQAQADFRQAADLAPKDAFAALWLDIAERHGNQPSHLAEAAKRLDMGAWPAPVVRLFLGEATPATVLSAADHTDPIKKKGQVCEANFYGAEYALLQNKKAEALRLYKLAASDCPPDLLEARAAKAALAHMAK